MKWFNNDTPVEKENHNKSENDFYNEDISAMAYAVAADVRKSRDLEPFKVAMDVFIASVIRYLIEIQDDPEEILHLKLTRNEAVVSLWLDAFNVETFDELPDYAGWGVNPRMLDSVKGYNIFTVLNTDSSVLAITIGLFASLNLPKTKNAALRMKLADLRMDIMDAEPDAFTVVVDREVMINDLQYIAHPYEIAFINAANSGCGQRPMQIDDDVSERLHKIIKNHFGLSILNQHQLITLVNAFTSSDESAAAIYCQNNDVKMIQDQLLTVICNERIQNLIRLSMSKNTQLEGLKIALFSIYLFDCYFNKPLERNLGSDRLVYD